MAIQVKKGPRAGAYRGRDEDILPINWRTPRKQIRTATISSANLQGLQERFLHEVRLLSLDL